ncbi:hypothetical protein [Clostridium senegalense]|uniref:hypothetical protein n=1 Tax=Clostridium senegalense TaxID=1465809 RepID=UPI001FACDB7C|nr:hypothetical protein [Clostridium senegalense]
MDSKKVSKYKIKNYTSITRTIPPGMDKLFQWGIIKSGNIVVIKNRLKAKNLLLISGDKR